MEGSKVGVMKGHFEFQSTKTPAHGSLSLKEKYQEAIKGHMLADSPSYSNQRLTAKGTWQARDDMQNKNQPQQVVGLEGLFTKVGDPYTGLVLTKVENSLKEAKEGRLLGMEMNNSGQE